jgi:single-stranded-DNA-specific exonuclease
MNVRRILRRSVPDGAIEQLSASLHPVLRRVYAARGIRNAAELDLGLARLLPVGTLGGVPAAVDLLLACHARGGRVAVVGDFDADGATSTALVVRQLRRLGFADPGYVVPDRFRYGYGLTPQIVREAAKLDPRLLVTVDNGISSLEGVREAARLGIEVLVTDHHLPGASIPEAAAIVNPNLRGELFASKALAGVGVAFYLMAALTRAMLERGLVAQSAAANPAELLDLVALGTVADVVPLDRNNRILVAQGMRRIRAGRCVPGLRALLESAGRRLDSVTEQDLAFQAGPRLNAAGRLEDMRLGIECLLTGDDAEARRHAAELSRLNAQRRELEAQMQRDALYQLDGLLESLAGELPAGVAIYDASWHPGVVGLVAAKVRERIHRPVIAFAPGDPGWIKGSARSIPGVHVRDVLDTVATAHPGLLERFGGHAMAAGMTLREERFGDFRAAFAAAVGACIDPQELRGEVHTDGALAAGELTLATAHALRAGGPWGAGFPEPLFDGHFGVVDRRIVGGRHLRLRLRAPGGESVEAIAFRRFDDDRSAHPAASATELEMVYRLALDEHAGTERLQLVAEWLAPAAPAAGPG